MLPLVMDLQTALDPARLFLRATGYAPDAWQARMLRSQQHQLILNCSRQAGKSTAVAVLALHEALYGQQPLILLLAPALRQAQELFRIIKQSAATLGVPSEAIEAESALRLELAGGARVVCLPGKEATIRGFSSASLLIVDEAARVPDETYRAVRPMLAVSGGRLVLLSTPYGRRGFFYEEWTNGGAAWERIRVPAGQVPRISVAFLAEEKRAMGPQWFAQEYECVFTDSEYQVFGSEYIHAALSDTVTSLF